MLEIKIYEDGKSLAIATKTMITRYIQTYIRPVYLCYSYIGIYKENLTENLLLQHILFILIYHSLCSILVTLLYV